MDDNNERRGFRDRFRQSREREDEELQDWLAGPGAVVLGVAVAALVLWLLFRLVTGG